MRSAARQIFRFVATAMALCAIGPAYYALHLQWFAPADFDVIGILWVLQNLPRLTAIVMTAGFAWGAVYCWIRSMQA